MADTRVRCALALVVGAAGAFAAAGGAARSSSTSTTSATSTASSESSVDEIPDRSPRPGASPLGVVAALEEAWRVADVDQVIACLSSRTVELALEHTGPPGGRFTPSQAEFLVRDLLHYGETIDFRVIGFEWTGDTPRARSEWLVRMGEGEVSERIDLDLAREGETWRIVKIAGR